MGDPWEESSTIGTWVAVFLAIVALVGFVGPYLVWRQSKTERHQAIDALENGEAETGGFTTRGIRVSPSIRLFRHIKAPILHREPQILNRKLVWNNDMTSVSQQSSGWVQLCMAIRAYKIETDHGDPLRIDEHDHKTRLPIHRNWVLILGIIGRFTRRSDAGKLPAKRKGGVRSLQATPGRALSLDRKLSGYGLTLWSANRISRGGVNDMVDNEGLRYRAISGLFGIIWVDTSSEESKKAYYIQHKSDEIGMVASDTLTVDALFWLSVGCLPSPKGNVFSLENVENLEGHEESPEPEPVSRPMRRATQMSYPARGGVHFENDDSYEEEQPRRRATQFVVAMRNATRTDRVAPGAPRGFSFNTVNERVEALANFANSIHAEDDKATVYSLSEVDLTSDDRTKLKETSGSTYLPVSLPWVRLGKEGDKPSFQCLTFLDRGAAQVLAQVLLDLPLSPEGYLINTNKESMCRATLCNAAQSLPHILGRVTNDIDCLDVPPASKDVVIAALNDMFNKTLAFEQNRSFFRAIYELDCALANLVASVPEVNTAIGVLMLTSAEFRAIIHQSARLIPESKDLTVDLAFLPTPSLNMPSVIGVVQKLPVDLGVLFPGKRLPAESIGIKYNELMLGALKACLRSAVLETSLDSSPLFEAFMSMKDTVLIG